ncbi:hypothetical protein OAG32_04255, partial [Akkermansiaceae bacterium]|nr:hypothetical protein [Akkermansiaceae bacterium]
VIAFHDVGTSFVSVWLRRNRLTQRSLGVLSVKVTQSIQRRFPMPVKVLKRSFTASAAMT